MSRATPPTGPAAWLRDLTMGMRFAWTGGREGWFRTVLTAVGVGLGVAVMLVGASVPNLLAATHARDKARETVGGQLYTVDRADNTIVFARAQTTFEGQGIQGRIVRPDGKHPPRPPGVDKLPGPGQMLVSPALKKLLDDPGNELLRERIPYKNVGTIGDEGLLGPAELTFLAGSDTLRVGDGYRTAHFGREFEREPLRAPLMVLVIMGCVVLLTPVMVFIGTAIRFGGERREQRLAALRLVGATVRSTRRMAAGEALFGSLLGLVAGVALFFALRQLAMVVTLWNINVFPTDVTPDPLLAGAIAALVPLMSIVVTLLAQRAVTAEPLGLVRNRPVRRRRLWWRVLLPLAGLALLLPMIGQMQYATDALTSLGLVTGAVLLLLGVTALLPWLVEAVVGRLHGRGPVPWQLAVRRLQLSSGAATRAVSGITVAVTGAIAVHMLLTGMQIGYQSSYAEANLRPQLALGGYATNWPEAQRALKELRATEGVRQARGYIQGWGGKEGDNGRVRDVGGPGGDYRNVLTEAIKVGDCTQLRELAHIGSCKDGDVFVTDDLVTPSPARSADALFAKPGARLNLNPNEGVEDMGPPRLWTIPASARTVKAKESEEDRLLFLGGGVLATPGAIDLSRMQRPHMELKVDFDPSVPDVVERIRTTATRINPTISEHSYLHNPHDQQLVSIRNALFAGAVVTLVLIGAGLVITTVEQLRERRRLLSVLHAYGIRRSTLGWSVLWQTAVPVVLGLALAVAGGVGLGSLLLAMIESAVFVDWWVVAGMAAIGGGVILLVTAVSLPPLWRMMRPDGLRTE